MRQQREHAQAGGKLAEGDRKKRIFDGADYIFAMRICKKETKGNFYELLGDFGDRRRNEVVPPLKPTPEAGEDGHEQDARREHAIGCGDRRLPLRRAHGAGEQEHGGAARQPDRREQQKGTAQDGAGIFAARFRAGYEARQSRRNARSRHGQKKAIERENHLIQSHPLPAEEVREGHAVQRAENFCDDAADGNDCGALEKALLFHM